MKRHHLYEIKKRETNLTYYLYILEKIDCADSMDIFGIRSDFAQEVLPLYSPAITYEKDLGQPTPKMLIQIDINFYYGVKMATIIDIFTTSSAVAYRQTISFLKDRISDGCTREAIAVQNRVALPSTPRHHHILATAINRSLGIREAKLYVEKKINTQTTDS